MKKVIGRVISPENTGFSPGRFISENTQLMKLIQDYIDDEGKAGMFIFLDLEKAFDRVSWDYMKEAVEKLGFGKDFLKWLEVLYDKNKPPTRQIKVNGHKGPSFGLGSGVAQGCPLSPLLFLCVMEGFTRRVKSDKDIKGIKIGKLESKISQFADDTALLLRTFGSIEAAWKILEQFEKASGMRINKDKTEGLLLGSCRERAGRPDWIKWCRDGDYIISLGVPFGNEFEGSAQERDFWRGKYLKTKSLMARWGAIFKQTYRGRVMLVNSMIYSRFRYWTQVMVIPEDINEWIKQDAHELIWAKDPIFDAGEEGSQVVSHRRIKEHAAKGKWRKGGLGILEWDEHLKSLRRKWIIRYLDATRGEWKQILDWWLNRHHGEGRGIVIGRGDVPEAPNEFWTRAVAEIDQLELEPKGDYEDVAERKAESIWRSRRHEKPEQVAEDEWETRLSLTKVGDFLDRGTNSTWSNMTWRNRARDGPGLAAMGGDTQFNQELRTIRRKLKDQVDAITQSPLAEWQKGEMAAFFTEKGELKIGTVITAAQTHIIREHKICTDGSLRKIGNVIVAPEVPRNAAGEEVTGDRIARPLIVQDKFYGVAEYTSHRITNLDVIMGEDRTLMRDVTVKQMTDHQVARTTVRPTCERQDRWPAILNLNEIKWEEVWDWFRQGLATPVDFGPRFKMLHGLLGTANKMGTGGGCRLGCGARSEDHIHILRCPILAKIWKRLMRIIETCRGGSYRNREAVILLGWNGQQVEKGTVALCSMLLKIILIEWFMVIRKQQNFDVDKVWRIFWVRAERKWKEFARERAADLHNIQQRGSSYKSTLKGINGQMEPLGSMDDHGNVTCKLNWNAHREWTR